MFMESWILRVYCKVSDGPHVNFAREANRPKIEFIDYNFHLIIYISNIEIIFDLGNKTISVLFNM